MVFFVPLQEQFAVSTNKSYHVFKMIGVLHIIIGFLASDKQGLLQTKIQV